MMLDRLNEINDVKIYSVFSEEFASYGRVLEGIDCSSLSEYMREHTKVPENGNIYVASDKNMEALPVCSEIQNSVYGQMPIQIGYCNGNNRLYNAFEYHKGSEINVAVTPLCLVLGHVWEIKDNKYSVGDEKVFFVPEGTVIEFYQTTLHYSPCTVSDSGFKAVVVLPRGTNTPLENVERTDTDESRLLFQKNKWLLAHPEVETLLKQGAFVGLVGENKEIKF